jgi:transposase
MVRHYPLRILGGIRKEKKMSHGPNNKVIADVPDSEVEPRAVRRHYTAEYKQRVLEEIDQATGSGGIGAILRREGLYSQAISKWRQQRAQGGLEGLVSQKRGPKAVPEAVEIARLKRENERLHQKLKKAELIIEVQKKVSQILGLDESEANLS